MTFDSTFDWYKFHKIGCRLYDSGSEEDLRTAINRFYYGSFCFARDFLISNKIFYNSTLKRDLCSNKGVVHRATRLIFMKEKHKLNHIEGRKINKWLLTLRDYRNKVDYDSSIDFDLDFIAKKSLVYSEKIFTTIKKFQ